MKTWLAIITAGSILMANAMSIPDDTNSRLDELKGAIVMYNTERAYASNSSGTQLVYITVRDHIAKIKSMTPLVCTDGYLYLQHIDEVNSSTPLEPSQTTDITQEINRICDTSITLADLRNNNQSS